ncbi:hypothetical protein SS50377_27204 [Spironucleus salmonicida]|nr:hypothetical protein SS50377_27204 [Spironucleus salmonicida]
MTLHQNLIQLSQHLPDQVKAILTQIATESEDLTLSKKVLEITLEETQQLLSQFQQRAGQLAALAETYKDQAFQRQKDAETLQVQNEKLAAAARVLSVKNAQLHADLDGQAEVLAQKEAEMTNLKRKIKIQEGIFHVEFEKKLKIVRAGGVEIENGIEFAVQTDDITDQVFITEVKIEAKMAQSVDMLIEPDIMIQAEAEAKPRPGSAKKVRAKGSRSVASLELPLKNHLQQELKEGRKKPVRRRAKPISSDSELEKLLLDSSEPEAAPCGAVEQEKQRVIGGDEFRVEKRVQMGRKAVQNGHVDALTCSGDNIEIDSALVKGKTEVDPLDDMSLDLQEDMGCLKNPDSDVGEIQGKMQPDDMPMGLQDAVEGAEPEIAPIQPKASIARKFEDLLGSGSGSGREELEGNDVKDIKSTSSLEGNTTKNTQSHEGTNVKCDNSIEGNEVNDCKQVESLGLKDSGSLTLFDTGPVIQMSGIQTSVIDNNTEHPKLSVRYAAEFDDIEDFD